MKAMQITTTSDILSALWEALNEKPKFVSPTKVWKQFDEILLKGWATLADVEDIFDALDTRLYRRPLSVPGLCDLLGIRTETAYYKPSPKSIEVMGFESLRCEDVAHLLFILERMGFNTDASYLIAPLLPRLKAKETKLLSSGELTVFWFQKYHHKSDVVALFIEDWWRKNSEIKKFTTERGYKISAELDEAGNPMYIKVSAPKFRKRPEPVNTKCPECGYQWMKGDPESSAIHRKEHKRRMSYLDPQPHPAMLSIMGEPDFELVTSRSPKWKHKEMYERGLAFKRMFGYDFVQWKSREGDDDPDVHGYLFTDKDGIIVGACSFRHRQYKEGMVWVLDWAWVCPKFRRTGELAKRWNYFTQHFGAFELEPPLSDEMKNFLQKHRSNGVQPQN